MSVEADILCKNGRTIPYYFKARRIRQEGQSFMVVLGTDISERVQVEEALRRSELKLKAVLDNSGVAIAWADEQERIEYANHKFTELFGYTLEEVPTVKEWNRCAYPDEEYRRHIVALLTSAALAAKEDAGRIPPIEVNISCKDGSVKTVVLIGSWVDKKLLVIFNDITERKLAEQTCWKVSNAGVLRWKGRVKGCGTGM